MGLKIKSKRHNYPKANQLENKIYLPEKNDIEVDVLRENYKEFIKKALE